MLTLKVRIKIKFLNTSRTGDRVRVEASQSQNIFTFVLRDTHIKSLAGKVHFGVPICMALILFRSLNKETFLAMDFNIRPRNLHLTLPKSSKHASTS